MRHRFFLVANAGAGLKSPWTVDRVVRGLEAEGASVSRATPPDFPAIGRAVRDAARSGAYDAILVGGGDGTIRAAAAGLIGSDVPLGIVPSGTANVLACEIGLTSDPGAVCRMLRGGLAHPVACGRANGEPFLLMVGAGFDARVVGALNHALKSRIGKAAYVGPVLGALMRPADALRVTIDGREHEASWVVVANARHYGGRFVLAPHTGVRERGLEAILFRARTQSVLLGQLLSLARGRLDARAARAGDVEMWKCSQVRVLAHRPVPVQVDGDAFGATPVELEAGSDTIRLIFPPGADGGPPR